MKSIILYLFIFLYSCSSSVPLRNQNPQEVVVIFKDAPDQSKAKEYNLSTVPRTVFNYVDNDYKLIRYQPKLIGYDTLKIPTFEGYAEVMHRYQALEDNYYLLQEGDTILFTYSENLRPQIKSLCSKENTWLYNIPESDNRTIDHQTGYTLTTICTDNFFVSRWRTLNSPKYKNDKSKQDFVISQLQKYPNVDSLKLIYDKYLIDYKQCVDSLESAGCIVPLYANFFRDNTKNREEVLHCDSLLRFPSAHAVIAGELVGKSIVEIAKFAQDTTISKYARLSALELQLQAYEELSWGKDPKVIAKCAEVYEKLSGQSFYTTTEPIVHIIADEGSMVIEDLDGNQLAFDEFLEQHKGKVIYVDLWASWCAPCIAGMNDAEKLRKEYQGEDIVFVYLAVRDKIEPWKAAIQEYKIDTYDAKNYFVVNSDDCKYLKEIDNRTIPQYLLYDMSGKLINHKAPSAASDEIKQEFSLLLNNID